MSDASPRTALVTGASTGIGRAIALALGRAGYDLAVTDLDAAWLSEVAADPQIAGRKVVPIALELRSESSIAQAVEQAADKLGVLDLLVNNAGRALQQPATDVTWAEWNDVIDINLKGSFFLSTAFARHCIARKRSGVVVSMASTHGLTGLAGRSVYGISKGGIIQMTRMLAIEWAPHGIRVNAIAPGVIDTPMWQHVDALFARHEHLAIGEKKIQVGKAVPLGYMGTPSDIAGAAVFLASDEASYVTAQTLNVDGGSVMS
jgi:NAD(P)-dependent dehydrogenase (short-subunit alcohol dehydrogenase family)